MDFLPPSGGVFRLSLAGSSPGIPCRRSCGCQGTVLELTIKKSPHDNLNLTIPSGMALVRVCYVAIRKLKTCSGSFGSRAGTLSKYVIINTKTAATLDFSWVAAFLVTNLLLVQCSIAVLLYFCECRPFHPFPSICDP